MEKLTLIGQIELTANAVQVRLHLTIMDGENKLSEQYHRFALDSEADVQGTYDSVNAHLQSMGWSPMSAAQMTEISNVYTNWQESLVAAGVEAQRATAQTTVKSKTKR
jgi:hypothetical protein